MCQGCTWSAGANGKALERGATGRTIAGTHSHRLIIEKDQLPALVASLMGGSTACVTIQVPDMRASTKVSNKSRNNHPGYPGKSADLHEMNKHTNQLHLQEVQFHQLVVG